MNIFFLSTDNLETQTKFKKLFNNRIIFFDSIKESDNLRKTSLENAIIDLFLLSKCKQIIGSNGSSYSKFAILLNNNY